MCGIAGYVEKTSLAAGYETLERMLSRVSHRGPDGQGIWSHTFDEWTVSLGHRRLSIIDLEGGAQPMGTDRSQITFNGEIYSFLELKAALEREGRGFRTRSDTEVILHQLEAHGAEGLPSLNGMFAFAWWDSASRELWLARDRAGVKPLYYTRLPHGGLAFASELTSLLSHPRAGRSIDWSALQSYFFSDYISPPFTAIEGVRKLEPGHWIRWRDGELSAPRPFWRLDPEPKILTYDETKLEQELWERLKGAVKRQLIADVPVGVFLSGGIDSSLVAAAAAQSLKVPLRTFSIAFEEKDYDESAFARIVARHLGTQHAEETLSEGNLLEHLDEALNTLDEPMADPSIVPTYLLSRLAARHVKVVLGGDAGDELWAGYPTYRAHRYAGWFARLPRSGRDLADKWVGKLPVSHRYQSFEWKAKRFVQRWEETPARRHLRWMSNTDLPQLRELFPKGTPLDLREAKATSDPLNDLLALDFSTYLPHSVLTKVDRAAMAHGLEVRPPFLDNELIDWAFALPSSLKLRGSTGKYLLKRAGRAQLPKEILHRRKKGFGIPLGRWLRGPLKGRLDAILADSPLWSTGLLSRDTLAAWHSFHSEGRGDFSKPLWALLVLDHWMRRENLT